MTQTGAPQRDEPRDPQPAPPMWVEPAKPGAYYPPGFEPDGAAPAVGAASRDGAAPVGGTAPGAFASVDNTAGRKRTLGRRPVVAGVVGGVLIDLMGFGGGFAVGTLTGGDDGDQFPPGLSRLAPPAGEGYPGGDQDGDVDGGPGQRLAPLGGLPDAGNHKSDTDT